MFNCLGILIRRTEPFDLVLGTETEQVEGLEVGPNLAKQCCINLAYISLKRGKGKGE